MRRNGIPQDPPPPDARIEKVQQLRRRAASGERLRHLAVEYGVALDTVQRAVSGRSWRAALARGEP